MITIVGDQEFNITYKHSGLFVTSDEWTHPKREIDTYEVIFVVEGDIFIQEVEAQYHLSKGDILFLYPNKTHFGYKPSVSKTSFYWAHFTISDFTLLEINSQYLSFPDNYKFTGLFKQLLHIANTSSYPGYSSDVIMLLILNEMAIVLKENQYKSNKLINEITEWIRINIDKKITLDDISENFKYNADYLSGVFKRIHGIGLKEYINNKKMKYIKNLLISSDYSIKQIADIMGYDGPNQFIHYFKYHENSSPTKYRNMYYNTHLNKK